MNTKLEQIKKCVEEFVNKSYGFILDYSVVTSSQNGVVYHSWFILSKYESFDSYDCLNINRLATGLSLSPWIVLHNGQVAFELMYAEHNIG